MTDPLPLLKGVRRAGDGWRADCPTGHRSRGTLSLRQGADGVWLVRCFAGCELHQVLGAIGLTIADLFPDRPLPATPEGRREARALGKLGDWQAALTVLQHEATVVRIAALDLLRGQTLEEADVERLRESVRLIDQALEVLA